MKDRSRQPTGTGAYFCRLCTIRLYGADLKTGTHAECASSTSQLVDKDIVAIAGWLNPGQGHRRGVMGAE